jgi:hypothetical protein
MLVSCASRVPMEVGGGSGGQCACPALTPRTALRVRQPVSSGAPTPGLLTNASCFQMTTVQAGLLCRLAGSWGGEEGEEDEEGRVFLVFRAENTAEKCPKAPPKRRVNAE